MPGPFDASIPWDDARHYSAVPALSKKKLTYYNLLYIILQEIIYSFYSHRHYFDTIILSMG